MKKITLLLLFTTILFAHKINLFITLENNRVNIYSYFANGKACQNCKLIIKKNNEKILTTRLNKDGKYSYISKYPKIEIIVDGSSGHLTKKIVTLKNLKNENLKTHLDKENKEKYLKIFLALLIIAIFFYLFKKVKKR